MKRLDYANITKTELEEGDYTDAERLAWARFHDTKQEKRQKEEKSDPFNAVLKKYERK